MLLLPRYTHDIISTKSFEMPAAAVTVTATFSAVPTISMNKTSITDVPAAGVTNASESGVYSCHNGADDSGITVTCDGTIVTAASKSNGAITYSVAANSSGARDGWIKVQYGSEDPHQITVSQLSGVTAKTYTRHNANGDNITFHLDENVTWNADASGMPMIATVVGDEASFKSVGGVLKLILFNIPAEADFLKFSATSKQITGDFEIEDASSVDPVLGGLPVTKSM